MQNSLKKIQDFSTRVFVSKILLSFGQFLSKRFELKELGFVENVFLTMSQPFPSILFNQKVSPNLNIHLQITFEENERDTLL